MTLICQRCPYWTRSLKALLAHADAAHPCWRQHKFPTAWLDARRGAVPICVRCGFDAREAA